MGLHGPAWCHERKFDELSVNVENSATHIATRSDQQKTLMKAFTIVKRQGSKLQLSCGCFKRTHWLCIQGPTYCLQHLFCAHRDVHGTEEELELGGAAVLDQRCKSLQLQLCFLKRNQVHIPSYMRIWHIWDTDGYSQCTETKLQSENQHFRREMDTFYSRTSTLHRYGRTIWAKIRIAVQRLPFDFHVRPDWAFL